MADAVLPVLLGEDLVHHLEEAHCARIGCAPRGFHPATPRGLPAETLTPIPHAHGDYTAKLHERDHRLQFTDGSSPFGHVHDVRAVA